MFIDCIRVFNSGLSSPEIQNMIKAASHMVSPVHVAKQICKSVQVLICGIGNCLDFRNYIQLYY